MKREILGYKPTTHRPTSSYSHGPWFPESKLSLSIPRVVLVCQGQKRMMTLTFAPLYALRES